MKRIDTPRNAKELVIWLEKNHMLRMHHDHMVDRNSNGWEQMHCEDCRVCQWERIKEKMFNGDL